MHNETRVNLVRKKLKNVHGAIRQPAGENRGLIPAAVHTRGQLYILDACSILFQML